MSKKFDINEYKGKFVVHCGTAEGAELFLRYLDSVGATWYDGKSYLTNTNWQEYKRQTCYAFNLGKFGSKDYYAKRGYTILEIYDFDWTDVPEHVELFKLGSRVRCISGNDRIIGKLGTVSGMDVADNTLLIDFDEPIYRRANKLNCSHRHHYYWVPNSLEYLEAVTIK